MKPQRRTPPLKTAVRGYFRKPDPSRDPVWLAQVLQTVDFLREQERIRKENERKLYDLRHTSKLKSTGPKGSPGSTSLKGVGPVTVEVAGVRSLSHAMLQGMLTQQYRSYKPDLGEKRSGSMADRVDPITSMRTIQSWSTSGSPPVTTTTTTIQTGILQYQRILDLVHTVDGDHVRPNPHRFRIRRINYGGGFTHAGDGRNGTRISGTQAIAFGLSATFNDQATFAYNKAVSKLYESIRGDVDLSVDAFQARQAGVMVNQRFKQARELFLRKAPFALVEMVKIVQRMKRSNPRDWGSLWLEWTYGWKPLAGSIYGAADQMVKVATSGSVRSLPVRASANEYGDNRSTKSTDGNNVTTTTTVNSRYQSRIVAHYAMLNSRLNAVAGLTSLNPISIAWELVPYSFVADWFVDVGSYLRNMESSLLYGSEFTGGYTIARQKQRVVQVAGGGNSSFSAMGSGDSETLGFQRAALSSSPMPRAPTFNPKLGTSRLISAASLLSQQLHSLKRK